MALLSILLNRIGDVGECIFSQTLNSTSLVGTPLYIAPEIVLKQPYDQRVDIWSYGCVLYELISLKPAFHGNSMSELFDNIVHSAYKSLPPYDYNFDRCYSEELTKFVDMLLQKKMQNRPLVDEVVSYFNGHVKLDKNQEMDIRVFQTSKSKLMIYNFGDKNLIYTNNEFSNLKTRMLNKSIYERKKLIFIKSKMANAMKQNTWIMPDIIINELNSKNTTHNARVNFVRHSKFRISTAAANDRPKRSSTTSTRRGNKPDKCSDLIKLDKLTVPEKEFYKSNIPCSVQYSPHNQPIPNFPNVTSKKLIIPPDPDSNKSSEFRSFTATNVCKALRTSNQTLDLRADKMKTNKKYTIRDLM